MVFRVMYLFQSILLIFFSESGSIMTLLLLICIDFRNVSDVFERIFNHYNEA